MTKLKSVPPGQVWVPEVNGIAAWTDKNHVYDVCETGDKIQGAASTRNMGLVYTCHMCTWSGCVNVSSTVHAASAEKLKIIVATGTYKSHAKNAVLSA